jgi:hypothetical protein
MGSFEFRLELPPPQEFTETAERQDLPAFRVFPFVRKDLRQARLADRELHFEIGFTVTSPDQGRSGEVTDFPVSNSRSLWLTAPLELTGASYTDPSFSVSNSSLP